MKPKPANNYNASQYDPFGMILSGRSWEAGSGYGFGFNGKLRDDEINGDNNSLDFGARYYDARLGRWLSVDPLTKTSASNSPYLFAANCPILFIDPDGNKETVYLTILNKDGSKTIITKITPGKFYAKQKLVRSYPFGIDTHDTHYEYDMYNYEVNAVLDLRGDEPVYTIGSSQTVGEPIITGASFPWMGRLLAIQVSGEYGGTMYSASNGQGEETKIGSPDAIINIDLLMDAAGLNKPSYSKKQIFQGTKYLKKLKEINKAIELTSKTKDVGDLFLPTIKSLDQMIDEISSSNKSKGGEVKVCTTCKDTLDIDDESEPWHPGYDTIKVDK